MGGRSRVSKVDCELRRRKEQDQVSRWSYAEALKESIKDTYLLLRNAKGLKKKKWGNTWAGEVTLVGKKK